SDCPNIWEYDSGRTGFAWCWILSASDGSAAPFFTSGLAPSPPAPPPPGGRGVARRGGGDATNIPLPLVEASPSPLAGEGLGRGGRHGGRLPLTRAERVGP